MRLQFYFGHVVARQFTNVYDCRTRVSITSQGQLQIWTEHSTLISMDLKILEISKKSYIIIFTT